LEPIMTTTMHVQPEDNLAAQALEFALDLIFLRAATSRLEWWATSAGTVPVQITPQPDWRNDVRPVPRITLWVAP
jgi:hypothetical protein